MVGLMQLNDGLLVTTSADGTARVWNPITAECLRVLSDKPPEEGHAITAFQHDSEKVVLGSDGVVQTWDILTGQLLHEAKGMSQVWQLAYDDRRRVVGFSVRDEETFHTATYIEVSCSLVLWCSVVVVARADMDRGNDVIANPLFTYLDRL